MKHKVTYTTAKTQDIYKINAKIVLLCHKKFLNLCQTLKKCEYWRHYQEILMLFYG